MSSRIVEAQTTRRIVKRNVRLVNTETIVSVDDGRVQMFTSTSELGAFVRSY